MKERKGNGYQLACREVARLGPGNNSIRGTQVKDTFLKLSVKLQSFMMREEGQDLIEYALVVALIAFAAAATMKTLSSSINNAFAGISNSLNTYAP
ncbi:hypothetical protein [Alloacidobacterium sp.]|uniref:Flp family type IVb pilin n=1 Tax=Alloacidobacterium sp. TaxID=2951999 RepID=UPI002D45FCE5|nr:hypothetical protein [Alloacidobacterium sp.]HYK37614.1 hypothetical protein [Alloacidobacterium sp.]